MNKEQSSKWKKLQGNNKGRAMNSFYTVILWIILVISIINGISIYSTTTSFLITVIVFCTLAIRHSMFENIEHIVSIIKKEKEDIGEDKDA